MVFFDPPCYSCSQELDSCSTSFSEDMLLTPPACSTPLVYATPEAPSFSPLSQVAISHQSSESMSIASESSFEASDNVSIFREQSTADLCEQEICGNTSGGQYVIEQSSEAIQKWYGFKIVGDNIDKNVRPRHQHVDTHTRSLHYFHAFAVLDRIDLSQCSEINPSIDPWSFDLEKLLPSTEDILELKSNFQVHIGRIITTFLECLEPLSVVVPQHIKHKYSHEMSKKSIVVS